MAPITSDLGQASEKATALQQAVSSLQTTATVSKDEQTTVAGNKNAHEAIQAEADAVMHIAQALTAASANLQSVAQEFAAKDEELGSAFQLMGEDGL
ncbi:hypothetical protein MFLO_05320 [Listeria floridensis FSL S10-1187]|uniref:Type VII secretion effector n=1 Tax=Listeria floridensis FSL S10-1187 TaxID=1265817 RepID=A0ABP3B0L7_9LIST|nr:TIGR04197 family type VII secretion effector [Listeria floridensis]EUJ33007.1 hypothetical protein MFLO_05320 [Listeria floridensis FSL S10-1187]